VVVLAELGRIRWTWQNIAECGRLPSRGRSLIAESVETGGRVQGVTGVSRDSK
jgi:hypothetical protein